MKPANSKVDGVGRKSTVADLEAITEIAEDAFVLYDAAGGIRLANRRLGLLLHLRESEQHSLRDFNVFSHVLAHRLADRQEPVRPPWLLWQPGSDCGRELLKLESGKRIIERVARPVVNGFGRVTGWVERYRDHTRESELPARLLQTDKLAALGQMVAGITHELNNPLTTIMGYAHLLLERPLDPKSMGAVDQICRESERAARIVRNLLMLARDARLERSPVNLNEIINRTLRLCACDLRRAGIEVEADLDPHLPNALVNPVQMQQVVLNLLVNSQQAIAGEGRPGRIVLRTRHDAGQVFLHVEDNGPGIAPDIQSRIFEPFFTTKPVGVGTGLGLSIVTGVLRQHGAEIELTGTSEKGTTFTVSIPMAALRLEAQVDQVAMAGPADSRRQILVVEAEPSVGRLIVNALTEIGHQVELTDNGNDALDHVRRGKYDLIVCDWRMRGPNGTELYRALSDAGGLPNKRLLLTGPDPAPCQRPEVFRDNKPACSGKLFLLSELKEAVTKLFATQIPVEAGEAHAAVDSI